MRHAIAIAIGLYASASFAATEDIVSRCTELHKIAPQRFLCFEDDFGHTYDKVSLYENSELKPAPDGLYETMGKSPFFLISKGKAVPSDSKSILKDDRSVWFFNEDGDVHRAYFCQLPTSITEKRKNGRNHVIGHEAGSCTLVPDGEYQAKGGLRYTIQEGAPFDMQFHEPFKGTCFHNWRDGKEVLQCEDRD